MPSLQVDDIAKVVTYSIALLAGGKSSRMRRDKGLVPFMGKPLYQHILEQVHGLSEDIFLITNQPDGYTETTYPIFSDKIPGIGALGGIYSALSYSQNDLCLILACDMPSVSVPIIEQLRSEVSGFDVAIPQLGPGMLEPFRAIYRKTCLPLAEKAIQSGERRAISFLSQVKTNFVTKETLIQLDPKLESFLNINTPGDLAEIEAIAKQRDC